VAQILEKHKNIWNQKKILRVIYTDWYKLILKNLKLLNGINLELGSGSGNFKEFMPDCLSSDVDYCGWLDICFDAHKIPFKDSSISNIILIDVLHHLSNPVAFFAEASRVLKKNGRIVLIEPFPSIFSLPVYKLVHPEPFIFNADYFNLDDSNINPKHPWESNQAISYLLFYKKIKVFKKYFNNRLQIIKNNKFSFILYPASGGFEHKSYIPDFLIPVFRVMEKILIPFRGLLAFRCFIVIEKI
jgi:SAM-dependent methyltransferase